MEKIIRFRESQKISFEEFFNTVTDAGICKYCSSYDECVEYIGEENMDCMTGNGCSGFDNSIENLRRFYLIDKCIPVGT